MSGMVGRTFKLCHETQLMKTGMASLENIGTLLNNESSP